MTHKHALITLLAAALLAFVVPAALAVPKYYEVAVPGGSIDAHSTEPGLVIQTHLDVNLAGTSFTLDDGQSTTFRFFDIWTEEPIIDKGEDTVEYSISATLNFVDPLTGATVDGVTFGGRVYFGTVQYGRVEWDGPVTITLDGDRVFQLALSDETFNLGAFGTGNQQVECHGAFVEATITQISSVEGGGGGEVPSVPDTGNTAMLMGFALAGLMLVGRKRIKA